ncbi:hypothetical protein QUC31_005882, partial [Theobroma cacao]
DKISFEKVSSSTPQSVYSNTLLTEEMEHNEVIDGIRTPQQLLFRAIIHEHAMRFCEVVEKSKKNHYCEACRLVSLYVMSVEMYVLASFIVVMSVISSLM